MKMAVTTSAKVKAKRGDVEKGGTKTVNVVAKVRSVVSRSAEEGRVSVSVTTQAQPCC